MDNAIQTLNGKPLGSSVVRQIDADTVEIDGKRYRLQGFNAPETAKVEGGIFVPGQVAQDDTERLVNEVARQGGYTDLVPTGSTDPYGRQVATQKDQYGRSLGETVTALGITQPNEYTAPKVMQEQAGFRAAASLFPSLAGHDPTAKLALDNMEKQANGDQRVYFPKAVVANEAAYAGIKNSLGNKAVKESLDEIARLDGILKAPNTPPHIRVQTQEKLDQERIHLFEAATTLDPVGGVDVRHDDRNLMNMGHNQLRASWNSGVSQVVQSLGGLAQLTGDAAKWEWLSEKGATNVLRERIYQGNLPNVLNSYKEIQTRDPWSAIHDTALWVGNNLTSSIPMMGALVAGGIGATAVGATGAGALALGSIPSAMLYSGQYYAEQDDNKKDGVAAVMYGIPSAVLDKVGLNGMMGTNILTKAGRAEAIKLMMEKGLANSAKEADRILQEATKREILEVAEHSADFARREMASVQRAYSGSMALLSSGLTEGGTEVAQQVMELLATRGKPLQDLYYDKDFEEQLINAGVAGAAIGGTFRMSEGLYSQAQWHSAANALEANKREQADNLRFNTQVTTTGFEGERRPFSSIAEVGQHFKNANEDGSNYKLSDLKGTEGNWGGIRAILGDPMRIVRGLADTVTRNITNEDGSFKEYRGLLKAVMAGKGLVPGENYSGFKQRLLGAWSNDSVDVLSKRLGLPLHETSKLLRNAAQDVWLQGERLPPTSKTNELLQAWKDKADANKATMQRYADRFGVELPEFSETDFLLQSSLIRPSKIHKNRARLITYLRDKGVSAKQAEDAVDGAVSGNPSKAAPASEVFRRAGVYADKNLNDLFEPNIYASMETTKAALASKIANAVFLGEDGNVLANLLMKAKANGEFDSEQEFEDAVTNTKAWYQIEMGQYNPMKDYPQLEKILSWGTTLTMLAGLGKATVSSIPEMTIAMLGTKGELMAQQIHLSTKEFMREWRSDFNKTASFTAASLGLHYARDVYDTEAEYKKVEALQKEYDQLASDPNSSPGKMKALSDKIQEMWRRDFGRELFERLGYNETSYNTQAKYELPYANMKKAMQVFAEVIGLRALTDGNRMAALAVASDSFIHKLAILQSLPKSTRTQQIQQYQGLTNEQAQAVKEMTQFGMNIPGVLDFLDAHDADTRELFATDYLTDQTGDLSVKENILAALANFVDSKITNPQPHNLPKYYYDPRFRIITAMTRFVAAQTTTLLPNLYKNYIKDGSVAMRYQAFVVIGTALLFAALADAMKDELAYEEGRNPFITNEMKKAQRAVYSAGLLGKWETVTSAVSPLYPNRKDPNLWDRATSVSPVLSWADRAVSGVYNTTAPDGDAKKGAGQIFRSLPLIGSFPRVGRAAVDTLTHKE